MSRTVSHSALNSLDLVSNLSRFCVQILASARPLGRGLEFYYNKFQLTFDIFLHLSSEVHLHASAAQMQQYCRAIVCEKLAQGRYAVAVSNPYSPRYSPSALTNQPLCIVFSFIILSIYRNIYSKGIT